MLLGSTQHDIRIFVLLFFSLSISSCAHVEEKPRNFTILAINDVYRIDGVDQGTSGGLARVRSLRSELEREDPDLLLLHAGDFLFPSLLSRQYKGEHMIDILNLLDGNPKAADPRMFVTFGNHEFDKDKMNDATFLNSRVKESQFSWLGSNIVFKTGQDGRPLIKGENFQRSALIKFGGVQVGVFSLTTDLKHPAYIARFDKPHQVARHYTHTLREQGAEFVVALTHQPMSIDAALLKDLGPKGPDLIIGGHEHQQQSQQINGRWVLKANADARSATVVRVSMEDDGPPDVQVEFKDLGGAHVIPDPTVQSRIDDWIGEHNRDYCQRIVNRGPDCLDEIIGKTQVTLVGEEHEMRRYETNLGNWIADQARAAFAKEGAQAAFINAGALRLNQNISGGTLITRRHAEQILGYPTPLKLLHMKGATLQTILSHAVDDNEAGNGWWLQISGLAFRHNPETKTADSLTLLTPEGPRPMDPKEDVLVVTNEFLADGGDGYQVLRTQNVMNAGRLPDLKQLLIQSLIATKDKGIAPQVEGRICNTTRKGPCQAITP